jgi:hypothetical protein
VPVFHLQFRAGARGVLSVAVAALDSRRAGAGSRAGAHATGRDGSLATADEIIFAAHGRSTVMVARELVVGVARDNSQADFNGASY